MTKQNYTLEDLEHYGEEWSLIFHDLVQIIEGVHYLGMENERLDYLLSDIEDVLSNLGNIKPHLEACFRFFSPHIQRVEKSSLIAEYILFEIEEEEWSYICPTAHDVAVELLEDIWWGYRFDNDAKAFQDRIREVKLKHQELKRWTARLERERNILHGEKIENRISIEEGDHFNDSNEGWRIGYDEFYILTLSEDRRRCVPYSTAAHNLPEFCDEVIKAKFLYSEIVDKWNNHAEKTRRGENKLPKTESEAKEILRSVEKEDWVAPAIRKWRPSRKR